MQVYIGGCKLCDGYIYIWWIGGYICSRAILHEKAMAVWVVRNLVGVLFVIGEMDWTDHIASA